MNVVRYNSAPMKKGFLITVMAGIQHLHYSLLASLPAKLNVRGWTPAFAGMTNGMLR
jgi:cyanate permease